MEGYVFYFFFLKMNSEVRENQTSISFRLRHISLRMEIFRLVFFFGNAKITKFAGNESWMDHTDGTEKPGGGWKRTEPDRSPIEFF